MAKSLEQIKELNLQPGDSIEVKRLFVIEIAGLENLGSDTYLGYYIDSSKGDNNADNINTKDNFYMTHSKYMSKYASQHPAVLDKVRYKSYILSFPLEEIYQITKK